MISETETSPTSIGEADDSPTPNRTPLGEMGGMTFDGVRAKEDMSIPEAEEMYSMPRKHPWRKTQTRKVKKSEAQQVNHMRPFSFDASDGLRQRKNVIVPKPGEEDEMVEIEEEIEHWFWDNARLRTTLGFLIVTYISTSYYTGPIAFMYYTTMALVFRTYYYVAILSIIVTLMFLPLCKSERIRTGWFLSCIADYFACEIITEGPPEEYLAHKKNFLSLCWPHGVISFSGLSGATLAPDIYGPTAVADVLLRVPMLRALFGVFGMISSNSHAIKQAFKEGERCVFLYPGGLAELFLSNFETEEIYFSKRQGCVKLAMQAGVDIMPCYLIGNTHLLHTSGASQFSRKMRSALTWMWGRWYLPIPYPEKCYFTVGRPIALPHDSHPTDEMIHKYHQIVQNKIKDLYKKVRRYHPNYVNKPLIIH
eukprot:Selendium_serpulae@DN3382_c0_g1_i1.p1